MDNETSTMIGTVSSKKRKVVEGEDASEQDDSDLQSEMIQITQPIIEQRTEEWLAFRRKHFCSSELFTLLQLGDVEDFVSLLIEKVTGCAKKVSEETQKLFDYGNRYEDTVAKRHLEFFSKNIVIQNFSVQYSLAIIENKEDPIFASSLDGMVTFDDCRMFLEFKTRANGRPYDKISISHFLQCQHIMKTMNSVDKEKPMRYGHLVVWCERDINFAKGFTKESHKEYIKVYKITGDDSLWDVEIRGRILQVENLFNSLTRVFAHLLEKRVKEELAVEILREYIKENFAFQTPFEKKKLFAIIYNSMNKNAELLCEKMEF